MFGSLGQGKLDLENVTFLVVDDNRFMRSILKGLLHSFGAKQVVEADDGASALKELQSASVDIVITDLMMDPLDGLDLTRLIRTSDDSKNPYVPIITVSGHTETHRVTEARDAGVNEFLAKPISAKALYSRIFAVITQNREFVRSRHYFGPCRRRSKIPWHGSERRKPEQDL